MWLGKWSTNKTKPLQLEWVNEPVKIFRSILNLVPRAPQREGKSPGNEVGVYFSYNENKNMHFNFDLKIQKLQTELDLCKARNLILFRKALIIKSLGLSQIVYEASNINVPNEIKYTTKNKLFGFLWNNKKNKKLREKVFIKTWALTTDADFYCFVVVLQFLYLVSFE